ncbi:hypothetical protein NL676_003209 [Syzygium grande]|nr:hypothetical protein NL676_003209 [Syzygium grande]
MHRSMTDDFQKLMALKQAYAEIILGMAKEAAGRVMAAERRATQFQEELFSSKGEALRLLLRLKQMCDAKSSEAETTSAWQQERIEELEAQLQESENTVKELREELNKARDELENERTHKSYQVSKTLTIGDTVKPEEVLGGNRRYTSRSLGQSQSNSQTADEVSGMNISSNKVSGGSNCSCKGQALKNYCRVHDRNFSVTVMRGKGPKLRRNKGTRTVRAFEKNSSAQLSFSRQEENVEHRTYSGGKRRQSVSCEATEVMEKSGALVTLKDAELVKPGIMVDATNRSKRPKESENIRQGNGGAQHINVLAATSDQDKINDLSNADLKACSVSDGISGRPLENKLLKFTFTRRKKETLCRPNGTFCGADITLKPKEQKLDHSLKMENSALTCETSQDSQQLVQIAEQLISLARNKWD